MTSPRNYSPIFLHVPKLNSTFRIDVSPSRIHSLNTHLLQTQDLQSHKFSVPPYFSIKRGSYKIPCMTAETPSTATSQVFTIDPVSWMQSKLLFIKAIQIIKSYQSDLAFRMKPICHSEFIFSLKLFLTCWSKIPQELSKSVNQLLFYYGFMTTLCGHE